jgi:hypothetical protein
VVAPTNAPVTAETDSPTGSPVVETKAPATKAPVTKAPVTKAPVTKAPVTEAPVTKAPMTLAPSTLAPVNATNAPTSAVSASPTVLNVTTTLAPTNATITASPSTVSPTLAPTNATTTSPTAAPLLNTTTVSVLVTKISLELTNVASTLSLMDLVQWKAITEGWFNEYYAGVTDSAATTTSTRRVLRHRSSSQQQRQRRALLNRNMVRDMDTTILNAMHNVTSNTTTTFLYDQQMNYVVVLPVNDTSMDPFVWSTELMAAIFADPVANADYHARLRSSESTIAFVNVASPIPIPIIASPPPTVPPAPTAPPPPPAPTVSAPTPPVAAAPTASVDKGDDGLSQGALGGIIGAAVVVLGIVGYVVYAATNGKPPVSTAASVTSAPLQSATGGGGGRGGAGSIMDTSILSAGSQSSLAMRKKLIFTPTAETISILSVNNPENAAPRRAVATSTAAATTPRILAKKDAYDDAAALAAGTTTAPTMDTVEPDDEPILDDSYEEKRCVENQIAVAQCSPRQNAHTCLIFVGVHFSVDTMTFDYSQVGQVPEITTAVASTAAAPASTAMASSSSSAMAPAIGVTAGVAAAATATAAMMAAASDQRSAERETSQSELSQDDGVGSKTGSKYADSDLPIEEDHFVIYAPAGKLGLVVDNPDDGAPVVHAIKEDSVLIDQVRVGDRLVGVDEIDVRSLSPVKVSKLISKRSTNPLRKLTLIRTKTDLDDDVTESQQSHSQMSESQTTGYNQQHRRNDSDDASSHIGSMSHLSGDDGNDSVDFHDDNSQVDAMSQTTGMDDEGPVVATAKKDPSGIY